ncbi:hypothetical protein BOTBODRAFT_179998 [Botryobasidium botryosum FD-172 SS1]|uniref:Uncharacterized protein n=1 Tax=Botryobasidium botryosum (strain FD-172 SS1) TaxID=930990 RepID=A0A067M0M3_BOTB1|nr:hypothetical protein BOTBODRAFT_179998 [Botryobasidium botryosum FD-172 SS1]
MDALVHRDNKVPERQRAYQVSTKPIYLRPPRSRLYMGTYLTFFAVGMVGTTTSIYSLIKGKKTE